MAARDGDVTSVRRLVEDGADPSLPGGVNGGTPLMHAIHKDQAGAVAALLEAGGDADATVGDGQTALMMAAGYGQTEIVRLLLDAGADAYATRAHGLTALDEALIGTSDIDRFTLTHCQTDTVETLLDHAPELTFYGDLAEVVFLDLKRCPEVEQLLKERNVARLRPRLKGK